MQKYQIVSKWDGENPLQILEISTLKPPVDWGKRLTWLIVFSVAFFILFGGSIQQARQSHEEENLQVPAPILDMKSNPHAAEDLNSIRDL